MSETERALPAWVRNVVLSAYDGYCTYCGCDGIEAEALDHVIPLERGGAHSITNLVPACRSCNSSKKDRTVVEWKQSIERRRWRNWSLDLTCPNNVMDRSDAYVMRFVGEIQAEVQVLAREHQRHATRTLLRRVALIGMNIQHLTNDQREEVLDAMRSLIEEASPRGVSLGA